MNKEIESLFGEFIVVDNRKVPVSQNKYNGDEDTYVVWSIIDEIPSLSANDEDIASVVTLDIDIFSNKNYLKIENKIKTIMKENSWLWSGDSTEAWNETTGLYYKTCTFEKERML